MLLRTANEGRKQKKIRDYNMQKQSDYLDFLYSYPDN